MRRFLFATLSATVFAVPMAWADGDSGSYLAARSASISSDYEAAAKYYARALARDPGNISLMENATTAFVGLGEVDKAVPISRRMLQAGLNGQIANLVLMGDAAKREQWDQIIDDLDAGQTVGPLFDGLLRAWALVGRGEIGAALEQFDAVSETQGVQAFGLFHKALALTTVGDLEGADRILSGIDGTVLNLNRRGILIHAAVLGQLGREDEALARLDDAFGSGADPEAQALRDAIADGTVQADEIGGAVDGVAEIYYSIAGALSGEANEGYTLLYSRMAEYLAPDHADALILSAGLLEGLERYELATEAYDAVPREHPAYHMAELGRAEALSRAGNSEAAIEALKQLAESHGDVALVHVTLGDTLRRLERFEEAIPAYDRAIELFAEPTPRQWMVYFARGIAQERTDRWPGAEADFRKALELRPDQPQVLNYLGYSFVEMQINLDEALGMIERAVAAQPDSGYITDSLGWVLYRLGRYEEAVVHMERAVELMPVDPIVNDHLGDVYWAVGRHREAEFQWNRALSFDPEPDEADRIRRKLDVGLDAVLADEGAEPLNIANDDG